jgi:hypothetical protein
VAKVRVDEVDLDYEAKPWFGEQLRCFKYWRPRSIGAARVSSLAI